MKQGKGLSSGTKGLSSGKGLSSSKGLTSKGGGLSGQSVFKSKKKSIKAKSETQKSIDIELHKIYAEMDSREYMFCTSCTTSVGLEHSHIIPRSKRRDLVAVAENITFHCKECHSLWENGKIEDKVNMMDFEKNMMYIKSVDEEYYNLLTL